jgi:hypothetical protein
MSGIAQPFKNRDQMPPSVIAHHVSAATPESVHVTLGSSFEYKNSESSVIARHVSVPSSELRSQAAVPPSSEGLGAIHRGHRVARAIA